MGELVTVSEVKVRLIAALLEGVRIVKLPRSAEDALQTLGFVRFNDFNPDSYPIWWASKTYWHITGGPGSDGIYVNVFD